MNTLFKPCATIFPMELVFVVLEIALHTKGPIIPLLLICKACYQFLIPRFYCEIHLNSQQLLRFARIEDYSTLSAHLRHLTFNGYNSLAKLSGILSNAHNLSSLTLNITKTSDDPRDFIILLIAESIPSNLKSLRIAGPAFMHLPTTTTSPNFPNLRLVEFDRFPCDRSGIGNMCIARLANKLAGQNPPLQALLIKNNKYFKPELLKAVISDIGAELLYLNLEGSQLNGTTLRAIANQLPKLRALAVGRCDDITTEDLDRFVERNAEVNANVNGRVGLDIYVGRCPKICIGDLRMKCRIRHGTSFEIQEVKNELNLV
ncbi:hypothetical protein BC938DRAFT_482890 [Jimgerdemannia flammicorona]|uniref:F-box domain-containing protein n=1 Tax=Jimgerdemannia flammicorona TaxID=994334 RepID=A0A433QW20_9FUNG|nr:hypothetical protein BC938DRAFT_482890 [Jimgerdemannia flammicorona]